MTRALVLMKAMPPTKGHERLIDFATTFSDQGVVLIDTAPGEPLVNERVEWISLQLLFNDWRVEHMELDDQDPKADGFWERWAGRLKELGEFDYIIGSEQYCQTLAGLLDARYIPYDPKRELVGAQATAVRKNPISLFRHVAEGFQPHLQTTITVWGAESTGKTTLSERLASCLDGEWVFEWARPYLEGTGQTVVDLQAMHEIWHGQYAVEQNAAVHHSVDKPFIVRDTDLYSTIGYWEQPHWTADLGPVPKGLISDAAVHRADLYIILKSNIPFEKDPIRYGGDHRESSDEYWISVAEKYDLPYVVLTSTDRLDKLSESMGHATQAFHKKNQNLTEAVRV